MFDCTMSCICTNIPTKKVWTIWNAWKHLNVLTNLDFVQIILPRLLYDDISIAIFLKNKLESKSIYMSSYVHPNIMIKTLQELCQTPIYKSAKISIRPN
jgi:hypothetical protein